MAPFALAAAFAAAATALIALRRRHRNRNCTPPFPRAATAATAATAAEIRAWLAVDTSPTSRAAIAAFAPREAAAFARDRLGPMLAFGTAGLRAPMGPGWDRMNPALVACATRALVAVLKQSQAKGAANGGVVVGFDARHHSRAFAVAAAAVFVREGIAVRLFVDVIATPVVGFAVTEYGCCAGIVITASHNPKEDNGYKVFWADGAQIRPHVAQRIEAAMQKAGVDVETDEAALRKSPLVTSPEACVDRYVEVGRALRWRSEDQNARAPAVVYTAMHGVGYPLIRRMFTAFGLPQPVVVDDQTLWPDPDFSTVTKPNPEEKGALDMAIAKATACGAHVVLANDPDADRLGVACAGPDGRFSILSGNEIAILLADYLLLRHPEGNRRNIAMVRSTVSSRMLSTMGRAEGFTVRETLTGFKWLSAAALELVGDGKEFVLAYEEALGYMIGCGVCDKDGVTAAAVFAELAGYWRETEDISVVERLRQLEEKYGFHLTYNDYLVMNVNTTPLEAVFDATRERGIPSKLGKCKVISVRDLTRGTDSGQADNVALLPKDDGTQFLTFTCRSPLVENNDAAADDVVISLRGSGTEPKCKWYSEIRVSSEAGCREGRFILENAVKDALEQVLRPRENKFVQNK